MSKFIIQLHYFARIEAEAIYIEDYFMNITFEKISVDSGDFTAPNGDSEDPVILSRDGVHNLGNHFDLIPWSKILVINVYSDRVHWVLKNDKSCSCGADAGTFNPACTNCDGFGVHPGEVIEISHDPSDRNSAEWYARLEEETMFWARQSLMKSKLNDKDGTPVFNLDIPRVRFYVPRKKSNIRRDLADTRGFGTQVVVKRSFAYHDEFNLARVKAIAAAKNIQLPELDNPNKPPYKFNTMRGLYNGY